MIVIQTERLNLRRVQPEDAPFIFNLVNQPSWLEFIGDHEVYSLADAVDYIRDGPTAMLADYGVALNLVERKEDGVALGVCGVVQRETLALPDLGFAFLPEYCGHGYAREAAAACVLHARTVLALAQLLALVRPNNDRSIRLLEGLGFRYVRDMHLTPEDARTRLYSLEFPNG